MIKKYMIPLVIYIVSFYVIGFILVETNLISDGIAKGIVSLVIINGLAVFLSSYYMGRKFGVELLHLVLMVILYIGSALVIFNDSAIPYVYYYLVLGFVAIYLGNKTKKSKV